MSKPRTNTAVAERLAEARRQAGFLTKASAADAMGVNPVTYRAWESAQNGLGVEDAGTCAAQFGVRPEWLLFGLSPVSPSALRHQPAQPLRTDPQDGGAVVVRHQSEIEVYKGGTGGVVIKAIDASLGGDEDQIIVIRPEHVDAVVAALLRVKAEAVG